MGKTAAASVPQLAGLARINAHDAALDAGVLAVDVQVGQAASGSATVTRQRPERAGRRVAAGTHIHIWVTEPCDDSGHG